MGLTIDGEYFSKALDAGVYVPPSIPSEEYKENYDQIRWDKPKDKDKNDGPKQSTR